MAIKPSIIAQSMVIGPFVVNLPSTISILSEYNADLIPTIGGSFVPASTVGAYTDIQVTFNFDRSELGTFRNISQAIHNLGGLIPIRSKQIMNLAYPYDANPGIYYGLASNLNTVLYMEGTTHPDISDARSVDEILIKLKQQFTSAIMEDKILNFDDDIISFIQTHSSPIYNVSITLAVTQNQYNCILRIKPAAINNEFGMHFVKDDETLLHQEVFNSLYTKQGYGRITPYMQTMTEDYLALNTKFNAKDRARSNEKNEDQETTENEKVQTKTSIKDAMSFDYDYIRNLDTSMYINTTPLATSVKMDSKKYTNATSGDYHVEPECDIYQMSDDPTTGQLIKKVNPDVEFNYRNTNGVHKNFSNKFATVIIDSKYKNKVYVIDGDTIQLVFNEEDKNSIPLYGSTNFETAFSFRLLGMDTLETIKFTKIGSGKSTVQLSSHDTRYLEYAAMQGTLNTIINNVDKNRNINYYFNTDATSTKSSIDALQNVVRLAQNDTALRSIPIQPLSYTTAEMAKHLLKTMITKSMEFTDWKYCKIKPTHPLVILHPHVTGYGLAGLADNRAPGLISLGIPIYEDINIDGFYKWTGECQYIWISDVMTQLGFALTGERSNTKASQNIKYSKETGDLTVYTNINGYQYNYIIDRALESIATIGGNDDNLFIPTPLYHKRFNEEDLTEELRPIMYAKYTEQDKLDLEFILKTVADLVLQRENKNIELENIISDQINKGENLGTTITHSFQQVGKTPYYGFIVKNKNGNTYFIVPRYFGIFNLVYFSNIQFVARYFGYNKLTKTVANEMIDHNALNILFNYHGGQPYNIKKRIPGKTYNTAVSHLQFINSYDLDKPNIVLEASITLANITNESINIFEYIRNEKNRGTPDSELFDDSIDDTMLLLLTEYIQRNSTPYAEFSEPFIKYCKVLNEEHYFKSVSDDDELSNAEVEFVSEDTYPLIECGMSTWSPPMEFGQNDLSLEYLAPNLDAGDYISDLVNSISEYMVESRQNLSLRDDIQIWLPYSNILSSSYTEGQIRNLYKDWGSRQHIPMMDVYKDMNWTEPSEPNRRYKRLMFDGEKTRIQNITSLMNFNKQSFMRGTLSSGSTEIIIRNKEKYNFAVRLMKNHLGSRYFEMPFEFLETKDIENPVYYMTPSSNVTNDTKADIDNIENSRIKNKIVGRGFWLYGKHKSAPNDTIPRQVFLSELISRIIMTVTLVEGVVAFQNIKSATDRNYQVEQITSKALLEFADELSRIFNTQSNDMIYGSLMSEVLGHDTDKTLNISSCANPTEVLKALNVSLITQINEQLVRIITNLTYAFMDLLDINPFRRKTIHLLNNSMTSIQQIFTSYENNNVTIAKQDGTEGFRYQHMGSDSETATITITTTDSNLWSILLYIHKSQLAVNKDYLAVKFNKDISQAKYLQLNFDKLLDSSLSPYKKAADQIIKRGIAFNDRLTKLQNISIKINNPFLNALGFKYGFLNNATIEHDEETMGQGTIRLQILKTTNKLNPLTMPKTYNKAMAKNFISNLLIMRGNELYTNDLNGFISAFESQDPNSESQAVPTSKYNIFNKSAILTYTGALQSLFSISVLALVIFEIRKDMQLTTLFKFSYNFSKFEELNDTMDSVDKIEAFLFALVAVSPSESVTIIHRLQNIIYDEVTTINTLRKTLKVGEDKNLQQRSYINEKFQDIIKNAVIEARQSAVFSSLQIDATKPNVEFATQTNTPNAKSNEYNVFISILGDCATLLSGNGAYFVNYIYYTFMLNRYKNTVGQIHLQGGAFTKNDIWAVDDKGIIKPNSKTSSTFVVYPKDNLKRLAVLVDNIYALDPLNKDEQTIRTSLIDHVTKLQEYVNTTSNYKQDKKGPKSILTPYTYRVAPSKDNTEDNKGKAHLTSNLISHYYLGPEQGENDKSYDKQGALIKDYRYTTMQFTLPIIYTPNMLRFLISFQGFLSEHAINSHKDYIELLINNKFDDFLIRLNEYIDGVGLYPYIYTSRNDIFDEDNNERYNLDQMIEKRIQKPAFNSFISKTSAFIRDVFVLLQPICPIGVEYTLNEALNTKLETSINNANPELKRLYESALSSGKRDLLVNERLSHLDILFKKSRTDSSINILESDKIFGMNIDRILTTGSYNIDSIEGMYEIALRFMYNSNTRTDNKKRYLTELEYTKYIASKNLIAIDSCALYAHASDNIADRYITNLNHITSSLNSDNKQMISFDTLMQHILGTYRLRPTNTRNSATVSDQNSANIESETLNLYEMSNVSKSLNLNQMFYANPLGIGHLIVSQLLKKVYSTHILPFINGGNEIGNSPLITRDTVTIVAIAQKFGLYTGDNSGSLGLGYIAQNNLPTVQLFNNEQIIKMMNNSPFCLSKRFYYAIENMLNDIKINTSPVFYTIYSNLHEFHVKFISKLSANQELNRFVTNILASSIAETSDEATNKYSPFKVSVMKNQYYELVNQIIDDIDTQVKNIYGIMRYSDGSADYKENTFNVFERSINRLLELAQRRVFIINTIAYQDKASLNAILKANIINAINLIDETDTKKLQAIFNITGVAGDINTITQIQKVLKRIGKEDQTKSSTQLNEFLKNLFIPNNVYNQQYTNFKPSDFDTIQMDISKNMQMEVRKIYETAHNTITNDSGSEYQYAALLSRATNALLQGIQKLAFIHDRYILFSSFDEMESSDMYGLYSLVRHMIENPITTQFNQVITELFDIKSMYETIQDTAFIAETQTAIANEKEFIRTITFPNHWFKSYPVQKVMFFQDVVNGLLTFEDIFSYANIQSISVTMDARHPVSTAKINILDPYNMLTNVYDKANFDSTSYLSPLELSPDLQENLYSMFIQTGTNVQIRLGYMNHLAEDTIIFNGKVTDKIPIEGGYEITAINHGSQLTTGEFTSATHIAPSNTHVDSKMSDRIMERYLFSLYTLKPNSFWGVSGYDQFDSNFDGVAQSSISFNKAITKYRSNVEYVIRLGDFDSWFLTSGLTSEQKQRDFIRKFLGIHNILSEPDIRLMNDVHVPRTLAWYDRMSRANQYIALPGETPWDILFNLNMHIPNQIITTRPSGLKDTLIWNNNKNYYRRTNNENAGYYNVDGVAQLLSIEMEELYSQTNVKNRIQDLLEIACDIPMPIKIPINESDITGDIMLAYRMLDYIIKNINDPYGIGDITVMSEPYTLLDLANILSAYVTTTNSIVFNELEDDSEIPISETILTMIHKLLNRYYQLDIIKGTWDKQEILLDKDLKTYTYTVSQTSAMQYIQGTQPYLWILFTRGSFKLPGSGEKIDIELELNIPEVLENSALQTILTAFFSSHRDLMFVAHPMYRQIVKKHYINNNHIIHNGITVQNNANTVTLFAPRDEDVLNTIISHMGNFIKKWRYSDNTFAQLGEMMVTSMLSPLTFMYDHAMLRFSQHTIDRSDIYYENEYPFESRIQPKDKKTYIVKQPNVRAIQDYNVDENKLYARKTMSNILKEYYGGLITIEGQNDIFPHDEFYISDVQNDIEGMATVRSVTYIYDTTIGFVLGIEPSMKVEDRPLENMGWGELTFKILIDMFDAYTLGFSAFTGVRSVKNSMKTIKNPAMILWKVFTEEVADTVNTSGIKTLSSPSRLNLYINKIMIKILGVDSTKVSKVFENLKNNNVIKMFKKITSDMLETLDEAIPSATEILSANKTKLDDMMKNLKTLTPINRTIQRQKLVKFITGHDIKPTKELNKMIIGNVTFTGIIDNVDKFDDDIYKHLARALDSKSSPIQKAIDATKNNISEQKNNIQQGFGALQRKDDLYDNMYDLTKSNIDVSSFDLVDITVSDINKGIHFANIDLITTNSTTGIMIGDVPLTEKMVQDLELGQSLKGIFTVKSGQSKPYDIKVTYTHIKSNDGIEKLIIVYENTQPGASYTMSKSYMKINKKVEELGNFDVLANNLQQISLVNDNDIGKALRQLDKGTDIRKTINFVNMPKLVNYFATMPVATILTYKLRTLGLQKFKRGIEQMIRIPYNTSGTKMYPLLMKNEPLLPNMKGVKKGDYATHNWTAYVQWRFAVAAKRFFTGE